MIIIKNCLSYFKNGVAVAAVAGLINTFIIFVFTMCMDNAYSEPKSSHPVGRLFSCLNCSLSSSNISRAATGESHPFSLESIFEAVVCFSVY